MTIITKCKHGNDSDTFPSEKKTVSNPIFKMKDDTKYLVTDSAIFGSSRSKKIIKIFAVVAACVAVSIGIYSVVSRKHNNVTERQSSNTEIAIKSKVLESVVPFEAIPGKTCGIHFDLQNKSITNGAFGGDHAILGMFRWHATVMCQDQFNNAASIISNRWLMISGANADKYGLLQGEFFKVTPRNN